MARRRGAGGARVTVRDRGHAALMRRLARLHGSKVTVGIQSEEGGGVASGGLTVAEVAEINEFGHGVPARSFVRAWADDSEAEIRAQAKSAAERVVKGTDPGAASDQAGLWAVGSMQARIAGGIEPANAPSTIAKKGSDTPLINTGQLRASIRHKVLEGAS